VQIPDDRRDKGKKERMNTPKRSWSAMFAMLVVGMSLSGLVAVAQDGRRLVSNPTPLYPETMRKMRLSGVVKVQVVIAPDGQIKETKVIGGHPVFVSTVEETLKKWKYAPAGGETTAQLEFNFHP
jgi:TonB family protein